MFQEGKFLLFLLILPVRINIFLSLVDLSSVIVRNRESFRSILDILCYISISFSVTVVRESLKINATEVQKSLLAIGHGDE